MAEAVDEAIKKTVGAVETIAPKAWGLMVRGEMAGGCIDAATAGCWCVLLVLVGTTLWRVGNAGRPKGTDICSWAMEQDTPLQFFSLSGVLACVIFFAVELLSIPESVTRIVMPEAFVAKSLVDRMTK